VLPGIDGVEVLRRMKQANNAAIILMMSAYHMVDRAVEAMKLGAYDYLVKPFHLADMIATLHRATEMLALRVRVRDNVELARGRYDFGKVVTLNEATRRMLEVARKAAESDHTTILLQGESGTGKSVFAKAIHYASPRAAMPLLELNCAALPDTLLESELFGFEPRAFTDARRRKEGLLERAPWGNPVSGRDRHHVGQRSGEASARARRKQLYAPGRYSSHQSERAPDSRHQC
jgi:two-component system, NtrC family, response regulator AtoC